MKTFRSQGGPFSEVVYYEPHEIDTACSDALKQSDEMPQTPQAIRIDRFLEKHFNCPVCYEDLGEGYMGCTLFTPNGLVEKIVVSTRVEEDGKKASERRVRSTLAHEGGHGLLHAHLFIATGQQNLPLQQAGGQTPRRVLCRKEDVQPTMAKRSYDGKWWEYQANRAIGGLLLPKNLVKEAMNPFLEFLPVSKAPKIKNGIRETAVSQLAEVFDANPVVVRIRLKEMFHDEEGQGSF